MIDRHSGIITLSPAVREISALHHKKWVTAGHVCKCIVPGEYYTLRKTKQKTCSFGQRQLCVRINLFACVFSEKPWPNTQTKCKAGQKHWYQILLNPGLHSAEPYLMFSHNVSPIVLAASPASSAVIASQRGRLTLLGNSILLFVCWNFRQKLCLCLPDHVSQHSLQSETKAEATQSCYMTKKRRDRRGIYFFQRPDLIRFSQ